MPAFAIPALFDLPEVEGRDDAIRIKGNPKLHERIDRLTKRGPGRPPHHVVRHCTSFRYRSKPRRIVAKVEFHPGELFPRMGFIVTNRSLPNEQVPAFYNDRGTAAQHIKEGRYALKWTRLSRMKFAANAVRLRLHALACNLADFLRTPSTPKDIETWPLTSPRARMASCFDDRLLWRCRHDRSLKNRKAPPRRSDTCVQEAEKRRQNLWARSSRPLFSPGCRQSTTKGG